MKKILSISLFAALFLVGCEESTITPVEPTVETYDVSIQLDYPDALEAAEGIKVTLTSTLGVILDTLTNDSGLVTFNVPAGVYQASASEQRASDGSLTLLNGQTTSFSVSSSWDETSVISLPLVASTSGQVVIKEFYFAGCQDDTGEGDYTFDKYVILYNNSDMEATLNNVVIGTSYGNAHASTLDYDDAGQLNFVNETWTPLWSSVAYTQGEVVIPARGEITIALNGGIDHTLTYSKSVDLSNVDYVIYDPEQYTSTSYHPAPSATIPTDRYMKAIKVGTGTAFVLGNLCPTVVVFQSPEDIDLLSYGTDVTNHYWAAGYTSDAFKCLKVEKEWVVDAVETYSAAYMTENRKRLTTDLDAGYVAVTTRQGYTAYRNVDKTATEAIEGNSDKLVYGYSLGTDGVVDYGTTDASGIDAEASIKNGAVIVYKDTNNSVEDFHQRSISALK
ncbi:MAG: DUF4876 domain-containing protein [Rikenellaceae bacterium]